MISSREVIRRLKDAGWEQANTNGSHHYFIHPKQPERGKVTVKHPAKDYPIKTLRSMEKQSGVSLR